MIAITETNPKNSFEKRNVNEFNIDGYSLINTNFNVTHCRGIFCYIKNVSAFSFINLNSSFEEFLCVKVNNLSVLIVYRSPRSDANNNQNLLLLLEEFLLLNGSKIILGDFNLPSINWNQACAIGGSNSFDTVFLQFVSDKFLVQFVEQPTRFRNNQKSNILDLVLSPDETLITNLTYHSPLGKSDHCIIFFECVFYTNSRHHNADNRFVFNKGNYVLMNAYLKEKLSILSEGFNVDVCDLNQLWNVFVAVVKISCGLYIPKFNSKKDDKILKMVNKNKNNIKLPCEVYNLLKEKNKLWSRYIKTKDVNVFNQFKSLRNQVKTTIRKQKENFYLKFANNVKNNPKLFWKHVNNRRKTKDHVHDLVDINPVDGSKRLVCDSIDKANVLGRSFSGVFNTESEFNNTDIYDTKLHNLVITEPMPNIVITELLVSNLLSKLNVYKSAGPDDVYPRILRECSKSLSNFMCFFFVKSLLLAKIPDEWKLSVVAAIFKKGDRRVPLNYRPISLTCVSCKVLESIVREHLVCHFMRNNLFHVNQYGFMKGKSTSLQLLKIMDIWTEAVDNGEEIDVLYTDFEKAFDKVNHEKLLFKLSLYGINDSVLSWIKEYLSFRKFQVRVNGELSECFNVTSGVPQGSVLGPVLFVIYVNDMFDLCHGKINMFLYADDAKIFSTIKCLEDQLLLQVCINRLAEWCIEWDLKLNFKKCNVLKYNYKGFDYGYKIDNSTLEAVESINDLGVVFESNLKFSKHVSNKISKANSVLGLIKRNFDLLPPKAFLLLYISLVRPHLEYAVCVWMPYEKGIIEAIEKIQIRATKLIKKYNKLSYDQRLKLLELPTLLYRRIRGDMIQVFKMVCMNEGLSETFPIFHRPSYSFTRGHKFKLVKSNFKLNIRKYYFTNRVVNLWNDLPEHVVLSENVLLFEKGLDECWSNVTWRYNYETFIY